jgi:hypothetical protein
MESIMELSRKKIKVSYDPAKPPLGMYPNEAKSICWRDTCTLMAICSTTDDNQEQKQPKYPSALDWIKKQSTSTQWNIVQ